jgi:hypothetical protein
MNGISLNTEFPGCSLRAGNTILAPACKLVRTGRTISLEFISFPEREQHTLDTYLARLSLEESKFQQETEIPREQNAGEPALPLA